MWTHSDLSVPKACNFFPAIQAGYQTLPLASASVPTKWEDTVTESAKRSSLSPALGSEPVRGAQEEARRTRTHHSISGGSRSPSSCCTSCRQRSWYSGCLARLYRTQERPLAVVSWPGRRSTGWGLWATAAPEGGPCPHSKALGQGGVNQGLPATSLG